MITTSIDTHNAARQIKNWLIELALNDELPLDLNSLPQSTIEDFIKKNASKAPKKRKEVRVYVIDKEQSPELSPDTTTDDDFITEAEEQGGVYSIGAFEANFNSGNCPSEGQYIRII